MSGFFVICLIISFAWLGLFYIFGLFTLKIIQGKQNVADSIVFGYLVLQFIFQIVYLPFFLSRGSYRGLSYFWISMIAILTIIIILFLHRHPSKRKLKLGKKEMIGVCVASFLVLGLACYISLHVPLYGQDTMQYISEMNKCFYRDSMWINSGMLSFHHGMCSMFEFFTISSVLTGIKPYYISLFTVRIVGVCLFSLVLYRTGTILFSRSNATSLSWPSIVLAVLVPFSLMCWGSMYTAEFFYWRINEAKGYCQYIILPLGFSVFLEMYKSGSDRKTLWKEQLIVGLAAVPVSSSSLMPYLFLVYLGTVSLLTYDKLRGGWKTICCSLACALPNSLYLLVYILEARRIVVF